MARAISVYLSYGRKVSPQQYHSNEAQLGVTVELELGDRLSEVLSDYTRKLQVAVDRALGDEKSRSSFHHATGYKPLFPEKDPIPPVHSLRSRFYAPLRTL